MKPTTDESLTLLFYALSGKTPPVPKLTEAEREARENQWLQARCLREVAEAREQEKLNDLAKCLGLPTYATDLSESALSGLFRALR